MRPVAWLVVAVTALPAIAVARDGEYDPCLNRGKRRIAVVYARSSGLLGGEKECKGSVYPSKKTVCEGDTVEWSVVNTCDAEQVAEIRIQGLEKVAEKCTVVRRLAVGGTAAIRCKLRKKLGSDVKQEYDVLGRIGRSPVVIDPELDIRQPHAQ
jgi:hypothetical protein